MVGAGLLLRGALAALVDISDVVRPVDHSIWSGLTWIEKALGG
jgi:hypothetical protein